MSGVNVVRDVMVPMRDGVRLATDLYLPAGLVDGTSPLKLPTLLTRTPYGKSVDLEQPGRVTMPGYGRYFAGHGYAVVVQDVRGRAASDGVWSMLTQDGPDGADTCAWIAQQPWSDGNVGMFGTSYAGGTQHALAMQGAPQLKTVIPVDAVSNMGYQGMRNGGAFELRFWNWVFTGGNVGDWGRKTSPAQSALEEMSADRRHYLLNLPLRRGTTPLRHAPEYEDWLVSALGHGVNDAFWAQNNILDSPQRYKDMPVFLVGGWYDSWAGNTTANHMALSQAMKGPVQAIMGPWVHGQQASSAHGQVSFGEDAAIKDQLAWRLEWFDRWLRPDLRPAGRDKTFSPIRIFVMGTGDGSRTAGGLLNHGGYWRDEQQWPPARTRYTQYYIHAGGQLSPEKPVSESSSTTFDFDPRDPVPSVGGNVSSSEGILLQGAWDQRGGPHIWNWTAPLPLSARRDVLVFQTEPLTEDMEVTGEIAVNLWAASSALDTDFTAKLIDVYPPSRDYPGGFDLNLQDGIIRARFRDGLHEERLMQPGWAYQFTIKLYPTSNVFKKGHRIRLDVSSSNFPRFDANPNTGEPLNEHRRTLVATNTVIHDRDHPSHILLPIIR